MSANAEMNGSFLKFMNPQTVCFLNGKLLFDAGVDR